MRKLSLLIAGLMLVSLLIGSFAMGATEVKVGKGDLKIGGILQAGYTYNVEDSLGVDSFWLKRARFLFWGTIVPDKVKYFVQLDHRGSISVLDVKARFFYIEKTEITVGRFLPNFTLYMPYSTAKLEMINYPWTTTMYAVWRQCGIQSTTKTEYVDFNLGIFNGGDIPNNWADNNDAKDFLLRADIKLPFKDLLGIFTTEESKVSCGGYAWLGFAPDPYDPENEETLKSNRFGGFAKADYAKDEVTLRFRGEFLAAEDEYPGATKNGSNDTFNSQAWFLHVGVQPVKEVEFLVRYDWFDLNTDMDDDGISAVTGGVNYYIDGINAMFYLNYIHHMAQWEDFETFGVVQAQAQITF